MNLVIANRVVEREVGGMESEVPQQINPDWLNAPHELVQLGRNGPPVVGPYRFMHKDLHLALQYAHEGNWEGLRSVRVPEMIPINL